MASTYSLPRNTVLVRALRLVNVVAEGEDPSASQLSAAAASLESFLKFFQMETKLPIATTRQTLPLVVGQATYSLGTDLLGVQCITITQANSADGYVRIVPREFWEQAVENKSLSGTPSLALVERLAAGTSVTFWPVPSEALNAYYVSLAKVVNTAGTASPMTFSEEWYDVLVYGLATNLADEYQLPLDRINRIEGKYQQLKETMMRSARNPTNTVMVFPI